jgi:hypothetical protein
MPSRSCYRHSECGKAAAFGVRKPGADPVHPDRDTWYCCPDHLPDAVRSGDEPDPGCAIPVTVLNENTR